MKKNKYASQNLHRHISAAAKKYFFQMGPTGGTS